MGAGKTTFLNMWKQHLRNQGFPVVEFNAWQTDFAGDPFIALLSELTDGLDTLSGNKSEDLSENIVQLKKVGEKILQELTLSAIRVGTSGMIDPKVLLEEPDRSCAEIRLNEYRDTRESFRKFKEALRSTATLVHDKKNKPLIVVIDELDRCRPSYAIELLEVAKHLFSVDYIVFVLAVNHEELSHSVKVLYGGEFNAKGYLRRFFDLDFRLPEPDRDRYIEAMFLKAKIPSYFAQLPDENSIYNTVYGPLSRAPIDAGSGFGSETALKWLQAFFGASDINLRQIAQAVNRLGVMLSSLSRDERSFASAAFVALILRTIDSELYHDFINGRATDLEVANRVLGHPGRRAVRQDHVGHVFEVMLMLAWIEVSENHSQKIGDKMETPLLKQHELAMDGHQETSALLGIDRENAGRVVALSGDMWQKVSFAGATYGFKFSFRRLELIMKSLVDEPEQ